MSGVGPGKPVALNANTIPQDAKANTLKDCTTQTQVGNWFLSWSDSRGKDTVKKNTGSTETQTLLSRLVGRRQPQAKSIWSVDPDRADQARL
jgi:hypothetical protein